MKYFLLQNHSKKIISSIVLLVFLLQTTPIFAIAISPIPTDILPPVPTADSAVRTKEVEITISGRKIAFINYDVLAIMALRALVNAIGTYTVNWINNDFKNRENGTGFPLDLERTFKNLGDGIAGQIIDQATGGGGKLCSPFRAQINIALRSTANLNAQRNADNFTTSCPLSSVIKNGEQGIKDFMSGDFINNGGWNSWNTMTQDPTGNPYAAMFTVQASIDSRVLNALGLQKEQLSWAKGFLSSQDCIKKSPVDPKVCIEFGPVKTPGSIVEGQLQKVFGSEVDQLNVASNFNQIVTALIGQLQKKLFAAGGKDGLFKPGSSYNANSGPTNQSPFGICSADKDFAIANKDLVTWTYSGLDDENTTYVWSGDEGLTGSTPTVKKTYTTEGVKLAQIVVTKKIATGELDADGNPIYQTQNSGPIDCDTNVTVSKYGPLKLSCRAVDAVTGAPLKNNLPVGTTAKWMITITGGSGELSKIDIKEGSTLNMTSSNDTKPWKWNPISPPAYLIPFFSLLKSGGPTVWFIANPLPIPNNPDPITKENKLSIDFIVKYDQEGDWGFSFDSILDADGNVPKLKDVDCGKTYTIDSALNP